MDPWEDRMFTYMNVFFFDKLVGKYNSPMGPMGTNKHGVRHLLYFLNVFLVSPPFSSGNFRRNRLVGLKTRLEGSN